MYKAILFDFFDVFRTDSYKAWLRANNIPQEGEYLEASRQQDLGNITNEDFLRWLSRLSGRTVTREELDANTGVDQEVIELAETLKQHYKIALLSNAPSAFLRQLLQAHDLERLFDEIIISSEVGMVKPSKEIFELIINKLSIKPTEVVFIDDNVGHVTAAEKNGIKGLLFTNAAALRADLLAAGIKLD